MKRYRIHYRCALSPGAPTFNAVWRGYTAEHAQERFFDSDPDDQDWTIVKVERADDV